MSFSHVLYPCNWLIKGGFPAKIDQSLVFSPLLTGALSVIQFARLLLDLKRLFTKTRFRCNFCTDKSVQTLLRPFQKPIQYGTFHFQQQIGAILFRSRNCYFESSVPSMNRSPIRYSFCDAPFHCPVQCEHSLSLSKPLVYIRGTGQLSESSFYSERCLATVHPSASADSVWQPYQYIHTVLTHLGHNSSH